MKARGTTIAAVVVGALVLGAVLADVGVYSPSELYARVFDAPPGHPHNKERSVVVLLGLAVVVLPVLWLTRRRDQ